MRAALLPLCLAVLLAPPTLSAGTVIPTQAWSRDVAATGFSDGAPIGGFGAGNVTWRSNGGFYTTRLNIGDGDDNSANAVWNNNANLGFYYYTRPSAGGTVVTRKLDSTLGTGQATYHSLFPKAWVDYSGGSFPVKARATQYSPIIPNDYQRTSYPVGVYEWELTNPTAVAQDVAVMLTWANTFSGTAVTLQNAGGTGLVLSRGAGNATMENQGEFALASVTQTGVTVTRMSAAALNTLVTDFNADGALPDTVGAHTIAGLSIKATLAAGASVRVPIILTWDIPITQVGTGNRWYRKYTRHIGRSGLNSWAMAQEALINRASWESQIDTWQNGVLSNAAYPNWLKSMLFNELYIYFAGGTYWEAGAASGQTDDPNEDMFSHLESYIYPFYGTSDVRFYGSWALLMNWPDIDKQALRQFADSVVVNPAAIGRPAALGTTAHDFGDNNDLFTRWNAYIYRDSTNWKDLNSKLVLMIYRDYLATGSTDMALLNYTWNAVVTAMAKVKSQDSDADGLPNSAGIDQTYDDMALNGDTAYCGSLFLAACQAAKQIALARGQTAQANTWQGWYDLAQPNFESQLWNAGGGYYNIATGSTPAEPADRIMSDQLCGHWYSKALGLGGIVPDARATSAFQKIYDNNFMRFDTGTHGIVNVMTAAGNIDTSHPQTQEVWVGTSWGAASGMVYQGLLTQASNVGQSLYNTIWNSAAQYWFRTPEAWRTGLTGSRAYYYMRATAVWAVKQAYDQQNPCAPAVCTPTRTPTIGPSPTRSPTPTLSASPTPLPCGVNTVRARMRAAGTSFTDGASNVWAAEQAYVAGGWGYVNGTQAGVSANPIGGTTDDGLYQAERYGTPLEYRFTVPNGNYLVRVKLAETYHNAAGARIFSLALEGATVDSGIDIFARVGGNTALDLSFTVTVSDGILNLVATASVDQARIGAIEATQIFGGPCLSPTPTATRSPTPSHSPTRTSSSTPSFTRSPTSSSSPTPTATPTASPTRTASPTASLTASITITMGPGTFTATPTVTPSASRTSTLTSSWSPSASPSRTASGTHSLTVSPTYSRTPTPSFTLTVSPSASSSPTLTRSPTGTMTPSISPTYTDVPLSSTETHTPTPSPSGSPTGTVTASATPTVTVTPVIALSVLNPFLLYCAPSCTLGNVQIGANAHFEHSQAPFWGLSLALDRMEWTMDGAPLLTQDLTGYNVSTNLDFFAYGWATVTGCHSYQATLYAADGSSATSTPLFWCVPTPTPSASPSVSPTLTQTPSSSPSATSTPSSSATASPSASPTLTGSPTHTAVPLSSTVTATPTASATATITRTSTLTASSSPTATPSSTPSFTRTQTPSVTLTSTASSTVTATLTAVLPTPSSSPTLSPTPLPTAIVPSAPAHVLAVVPVPNPQFLGAAVLKFKVKLDKPSALLRVRIYTKALNVVAQMDLPGAYDAPWNAVTLPLRLASAGLYYVQVSSVFNGEATEPVLAKLQILP